MVKLSLETAENGEFYGMIRGNNNEALWRTTDTYPELRDAEHAFELIQDLRSTAILDKTHFTDPASIESAGDRVIGSDAESWD